MRATTKISLRALNKGKPTESITLDEVPVLEGLKTFVHWIMKQEMGKRFDLTIGRNAQDADIIHQGFRSRDVNSRLIQSLDDMFDDDAWNDIESVEADENAL